MKECVIKIGLSISIAVLILIGLVGNASAIVNCPPSITEQKTSMAYAHGYFDNDTYIMTHTIDTVNKPGSGIIEYCVYPNDPFTGSSGDITPHYPGWGTDHEEHETYFGYDGEGRNDIPLDDDDDVEVGEVHYDDEDHTERVYIHMNDDDECGTDEEEDYDDDGDDDDCWREVDVEHHRKPTANPGGPYTGTEGIAVIFDGSGSSDHDGHIVSYEWNFGDGNTGTGVNPSHVYVQNGTYVVTLTVRDDDGNINTKTTTATIVDAVVVPIANSGNPYTGTEGTAVTFDGSLSSDPDGSIVSHSWNFGDGNIGNGATVSHVYAQNGIYTVTLTVTDNSGATNSSITTATISDINPVSSFSAVPLSGEEPLTVAFTDSSTSYDGIILWRWDFNNDGTVDDTAQNPTYVYNSAGTYVANLTICEVDGDCSGSVNIITVTSISTPTPTPTSTSIPSGDLIPPSKPPCPVAIAINPTVVNVSWQASTDNVGVSAYKIYRSLDGTNYNYLTTVTNLYYIDLGLTTGTTYHYIIVAFDDAGNPSLPSDDAYVTPRDINSPVVTVPPSVIEEATSPSGAIVTFSVSATDDIDGSIIPTCNRVSGSTFPIGLTTVTCTATDGAGNIGSAIFTVRIQDTTPPTSPSGLVTTAIGTSRIDLGWEPSVDVVGTIRYIVYRSPDGVNFASVGTTTMTSFQNYGLVSNTTYYYRVGAIDTANNPSANSSISSARTLVPIVPPPTPPPSPSPTGTPGTPGPTPTPTPTPDYEPVLTLPSNMLLEATSPSGAVGTFSTSAYDNEDGEFKTVTCSLLSGSTFPLGITYITCTAADSIGNIASGVFTITVQDTTPPTSPIGLTAIAISSSRIDLSWTASTDMVGVKQYQIYRGQGTFVSVATTSGTYFQNNGLIPNSTYNYYVVASDNVGNPSDPSNIASARTLVQPPSPPVTPGPSPSPTVPGTPGPLPTDGPDPCAPSDNTQRGQIVEVAPAPSVDVRFDSVLECGDTTAIVYYDNQWTSLPGDYKSVLFYDISTTSTYSNSITIQVTYSNPPGINENSIRLFHYENGNWVDVTTALDTESNVITGVVSSLSPFGLGGIGSESGSSGSGGSGITMRGSSFGIVGIVMLSICLIIISISTLKKKREY